MKFFDSSYWKFFFSKLFFTNENFRIWNTRSLSMSLRQRLLHQSQDSCHSVSRWPGPLMVRLCMLVTLITSFVSGRYPWLDKQASVWLKFFEFLLMRRRMTCFEMLLMSNTYLTQRCEMELALFFYCFIHIWKYRVKHKPILFEGCVFEWVFFRETKNQKK